MSEKSKKKSQLSYEQAMARLSEIVAGLDAGALPLDESLALFSEGAKLIDFCNKTLEGAQLTIEQLLPGSEDNG